MQWLVELFWSHSAAHTLIVLSLVVACGLAVGQIKVYNVRLGIAGVLFSGLIFGHYELTIFSTEVLHFIREFGLILFVYAIGLQVGPGFLNALYRQGMKLVSSAVAIVLLGVGVTVLVYHYAALPLPVAVGLFAGGTTNTPALAAAQQTLLTLPGAPAEGPKAVALGYAISYPFGILGIIFSMLLLRFLFKVVPAEEAEQFKKEQQATTARPEYQDLIIENPNLEGVPLKDVAYLERQGVVLTRIFREDQVQMAEPEMPLHVGDIVRVVGPKEKLDDLHLLFGQRSTRDLKEMPTNLRTRRVVVTRKSMLGMTTQEIRHTYNAVVSRVGRPDVEFTPSPFLKIQYGDQLTVVGEDADLDRLAKDLGNSLEQLNYPEILPIFIGITLGVLLGSVPFSIPGTETTLKLGLAGGPLIVAIFLSAKGSIGGLSWTLPKSSNHILREVGIVLFLAAVGLHAGDEFMHTLLQGDGLLWLGLGALITLVPLLVVGIFMRMVYQVNYMTLCGVLSGSMTDPPALAFANSITVSNAPAIAYATVYPFVMILRILSAQLLIQFFL
jgi:putative transport protein